MLKKLCLLLCLALLPGIAAANDIENPDECFAHGDGVYVQQVPVNNVDQPDRGSACVNAGGMQVLYVGGELHAEDEWHQGQPCGAVVVADQVLLGQKNFTHQDCD